MALSFDTKTIDLAGGPIDLMLDAEVAASSRPRRRKLASKFLCKTVSPRPKVFYAERLRRSGAIVLGHCMFVGDGFFCAYVSACRKALGFGPREPERLPSRQRWKNEPCP